MATVGGRMRPATAKIVVVAVRLACPKCSKEIKASNGDYTLYVAEFINERWDRLRKEVFECPNCNEAFRLPAKPFGETVSPEESAPELTIRESFLSEL